MLLTLILVALVAVGTPLLVLALRDDDDSGPSGEVQATPTGSVGETPTAEPSRETAEAFVDEAVATIFSYDYRTIQADEAAALAVTTDPFRSELETLFTEAIIPNVGEAQGQSDAVVTSTSLQDWGGDSATYLADVDMATTNRKIRNEATVQVEVTIRWIEGTWLVSEVESVTQ